MGEDLQAALGPNFRINTLHRLCHGSGTDFDRCVFELGRRYSRAEISALVGGNTRDALPTRGGEVLCGCFKRTRKFNPGAPTEVTIGPSKTNRALEAARVIADQEGDIPVFIWEKGQGGWEYRGRYRCLRHSENPKELQAKMKENPVRKKIVGVLYLEKV